MKKLLFLISIVLSGCLFSIDNSDTSKGYVKFELSMNKITKALAKVASADTLYSLDSLVIILSSPNQSTITNTYAISGSSDTGTINISSKVIGPLEPLRTWKAKFLTYDTTGSRKDTVHLDSISFLLHNGDTTVIRDTLNSRYSILRVRFLSNAASYIPSKIKRLRLRVNNVTVDSVNINSKTFDNILTYRYIKPNVSHTILMQALDNNTYDQGYERTFTITIPPGKDTTLLDSVTVRQNTSQGGTSTTIKFDASASSMTDFYVGMYVDIIGGTGSGQTNRFITAYNKSTKAATITPSWSVTPNNTSIFKVYYKTLLPVCGRAGYSSCTP